MMNIKTKVKSLAIAALGMTVFAGAANAEPRTAVAKIVKMRPYSTGAYFVTLDSNLLGGSACTTTYRVNADGAGAKNVIASLLTAYALEQSVQLEVPSGGADCEGFGTPIQSVFMSAS
jgi:hypothetical protein